MLLTSTGNSSSIFENEKLKVGTYKIQNLYTQGYVDIHEHSREMCCRPPQELQEGRGIWEIKPLGAGYMIRRVEPEKPEQFCAPMVGLQDGCAISVSAYPAAWRVEIVNDDIHRGFEYVRLYWGTTTMIWDISGEKKASDTPKVQLWKESKNPNGWWIWKLIPAEGGDTLTVPSQSPGSESLPSYSGDTTRQFCTCVQHTEAERDDLGTIVTEVTTVTTRKRYRVEDA